MEAVAIQSIPISMAFDTTPPLSSLFVDVRGIRPAFSRVVGHPVSTVKCALPQIKSCRYAFVPSILGTPVTTFEIAGTLVGKTLRDASADLMCPYAMLPAVALLIPNLVRPRDVT